MKIKEIDHYSDAVLAALNDLLAQLSSSPRHLTREHLLDFINADATHLLMAEEDGQYLGCLTLVVFRVPSGTRARVEDLVVQDNSRGHGIGKALVGRAIQLAQARGAEAIELTSHPSREAANRFYDKLGFEIRETNVYRCQIL